LTAAFIKENKKMKVQARDYRYKICPHCRSKNITSVALLRITDGLCIKDVPGNHVHKTGYLCNNCDRYCASMNIKFAYDRKEMRRDAMRLLKFLEEKP
jgi:hypothetical protein